MEKREHHNKTPGEKGELSVMFDISTGEMHAFGTGFWSVEQAEAYFKDWVDIVARIQRGGHPVAALVDLTQSGVQKVEVANIIAKIGDGLYVPGDAVAMLVATSLAKMQMRRVLDANHHEFFLARSAAEIWLQSRGAMRVGSGAQDRPKASANFFGRSLIEARSKGN